MSQTVSEKVISRVFVVQYSCFWVLISATSFFVSSTPSLLSGFIGGMFLSLSTVERALLFRHSILEFNQINAFFPVM